MSPKITATHERIDDIPAIIAHLKKMRVAEGLDNHFPTNGNWEGLSLGWTTVVWLTFILSEGDQGIGKTNGIFASPSPLPACAGSCYPRAAPAAPAVRVGRLPRPRAARRGGAPPGQAVEDGLP